MGGLALLLLLGAALAELADEVYVFHLFWLGLDARALQVVPARAPALGLIAALDPVRLLNHLPTDALLLLVIFPRTPTDALALLLDLHHHSHPLLLDHPLHALLLLALVLALALLRLINVLLLKVVEHHAFQVEGVEEGALGEGLDMVGIDGPDLEGVLPQLYLLVIFGDLCDFKVRAVDGFEELVLVVHGLYAVFDVLEVLLVVGVGLDQL